MRTVLLSSFAAAVLAFQTTESNAQGMPAAARENIHELFNNHNKITRKLDITEKGYTATTTTEDPALAKVLQSHVKQMEARLTAGYFVRRWDPAFAEYVAHYDDIDFTVEAVDNGVKVKAVGKTDDAIKVARNHAQVINEFVEHGWTAHDASHPAILTQAAGKSDQQAAGFGRGRGQSASEGCPANCRSGSQDHGKGKGCGECAQGQETCGDDCRRK